MYGEGVGSESGWGLTLRPATIFRPEICKIERSQEQILKEEKIKIATLNLWWSFNVVSLVSISLWPSVNQRKIKIFKIAEKRLEISTNSTRKHRKQSPRDINAFTAQPPVQNPSKPATSAGFGWSPSYKIPPYKPSLTICVRRGEGAQAGSS